MKNHIKIISVFKTEKDIKLSKVAEQFLNSEWDNYKEIVNSIVLAQLFFINVYGVNAPDRIWNRIMEKVVNLRLNDWILKQPKHEKQTKTRKKGKKV